MSNDFLELFGHTHFESEILSVLEYANSFCIYLVCWKLVVTTVLQLLEIVKKEATVVAQNSKVEIQITKV